ncbi:hypothetical protein D1AOALGA4SA_9510 [Olavius algarvensis Delta 1 endosymbiont]|nr:hypothetical protein D1AOALGA4SA_9510 [Olavius algarvensis Delta 1 endosymbiont]
MLISLIKWKHYLISDLQPIKRHFYNCKGCSLQLAPFGMME